MIRLISAAAVLADVAYHGCTLLSHVSPASVGLAALAIGGGVYPLVRRWSDAFFTGGDSVALPPAN